MLTTVKGNDAEVVKACTKALELDPFYAKALSRRALANERIGSWTALETALKGELRSMWGNIQQD